MPATFTNSYLNLGVMPIYPDLAKTTAVALSATQTPVRGTVMGEVYNNDTWTLSTGAQSASNFTLTYGGQTTSNLAATTLTAAQLQTALQALSSIGAGNATVVLTSGSAGTNAVYTITFTGTLGLQANGAITGTFSGLTTPGNASIVQATTGTRGKYKAYASGNTDGSQIPKGVLQFDCAVDSSGNITLGTATGGGEKQQTSQNAPMFYRGTFNIFDLTGLDANAVTVLGARIIEGTLAGGGIVVIP